MIQKASSGKGSQPMEMVKGGHEDLESIVLKAQADAKALDESSKPKQRTNISFDEEVHRAMRLLALEKGPDGSSMNDICNKFCREALKARGLL